MIRPTRRGVLLMAAGAPLALLLGVVLPQLWVAGLVWIPLVLGLLALDWSAAAPAPRLSVEAPGAVEIGAPLLVTVSVEPAQRAPHGLELALATGPRLRPLGRDRIAVAAGEERPTLAFTALRRGPDALHQLWARWRGPLGLVWRQQATSLDHPVTVTPDIRPVRDAAQLLMREAQSGEMARLDRGEGTEFEALTEWRSGMERRAIDWNHSARHRTLLARENRIERNNQILLAIDSGRAMCEPVAGMPRVDRAVTAALLTAYSALKLGDRVGLFGFDSHPRVSSEPISGARAFPLLQRLAGQLDYSTAETNYTLGLATLAGGLTRRSLVVVFTEFTDLTGAELMLQAASALLGRHLLLFVILHDDELEALAAAEPLTIDDVSRAVTAAAMLRERRLVVSRLRHLGIHVLEAQHDRLGPALVRQYLDFKRRNLL